MLLWYMLLYSFIICISFSTDIWDFPACWNTNHLLGYHTSSNEFKYENIVVIGDIHGNYNGLIENLLKSGIIYRNTINGCQWNKNMLTSTLLIQMGDVIDRGRFSNKCYQCLKNLQTTAVFINNYNHSIYNRVVRLIGNHELLWLSGDYTYRNPQYDTKESIQELVHEMLMDIKSGLLLGSYFTNPGNIPMFFSHAGIRKTLYLTELWSSLLTSDPSKAESDASASPIALQLVNWINDIVLRDVNLCLEETYVYGAVAVHKRGNTANTMPVACGYKHFQHSIYSIGVERGADKSQIGGVFWTDFSVLVMEAEAMAAMAVVTDVQNITSPFDFIQIVGHTVHMHEIVSTPYLLATCVDAGMIGGGRAYLEINSRGHLFGHSKMTFQDTGYKRWVKIDLADKYCSVFKH